MSDNECPVPQPAVGGMYLLDLTLGSAEENLALDEALLCEAEDAAAPVETLRLWEPPGPLVVVGRASRLADEVRVAECQRRQIPILRRTSGGAAIVSGPGCLMYSLVLSLQQRPHLRAVDVAHRWVLGNLAQALGALAPGVRCRGTSDLSINERKVSGNSLQLKRNALLYHGTILYDFPLEMVDAVLTMPPRQPAYRELRPHDQFVVNLKVSASAIRGALAGIWGAANPRSSWPQSLVQRLVEEKYSQEEWNYRR